MLYQVHLTTGRNRTHSCSVYIGKYKSHYQTIMAMAGPRIVLDRSRSIMNDDWIIVEFDTKQTDLMTTDHIKRPLLDYNIQ